MSFKEEYEQFLCHYGVKGMRWGVRKEYEPHPRKTKINGTKPSSMKERELSDKNFTDKKIKSKIRKAALGYGALGIAATAATIALAINYPLAFRLWGTTAAGALSSFLAMGSTIYSALKANKMIKESDKIREESEIDKRTGLRKKKSEFNAEKDLKLINPWFNTDDASSTHNCVSCTAAIELQKRGYEVRAKKTSVGYYENEVAKLYRGAKVGKWNKTADRFTRFDIKQATTIANSIVKEGGRGHLLVHWVGGGGHSVYYDTSGKELKIYDGQIGQIVAKNTKEAVTYLSNTSATSHVRVDNCKINYSEIKKLVE